MAAAARWPTTLGPSSLVLAGRPKHLLLPLCRAWDIWGVHPALWRPRDVPANQLQVLLVTGAAEWEASRCLIHPCLGLCPRRAYPTPSFPLRVSGPPLPSAPLAPRCCKATRVAPQTKPWSRPALALATRWTCGRLAQFERAAAVCQAGRARQGGLGTPTCIVRHPVLQYRNAQEEANALAAEVQRLWAEDGVPHSNVCALFRCLRLQGEAPHAPLMAALHRCAARRRRAARGLGLCCASRCDCCATCACSRELPWCWAGALCMAAPLRCSLHHQTLRVPLPHCSRGIPFVVAGHERLADDTGVAALAN